MFIACHDRFPPALADIVDILTRACVTMENNNTQTKIINSQESGYFQPQCVPNWEDERVKAALRRRSLWLKSREGIRLGKSHSSCRLDTNTL